MSLIKYVKQNIIQKKGKIIMNGQIIYVGIMAVLLVLIGLIASITIIKRAADDGMETFGMFLSCLIMIPCIIPISMVLLTVKEADMENNIESALNKNYAGYTNYHDDTNTFVYDDKKYSYDYNYDTNTLTVFDGVGTVVNSIQIEPDGKGTADSETTSESAVIDTSKESMNLDSTVVSENQEGLAKRIQDKIQEKYANAVITSFDTANLTGTFESDTGDYGFSWSDNMLEIFNLENKDQNVYYKVSAFYEVD